jgi:penicillin G amidase
MGSILDLNYASNWNETKAAFSRWVGPTSNLVYADTSGNIGYYAVGKIPIRKDGHSVSYSCCFDFLRE